MIETGKIKFFGHVLIKDSETGEILVDKNNQIHYENMSLAIARSLARKDDGWILEMSFGNGGATVTGVGTVLYLPPNTLGSTADLYNTTYSKVINNESPSNLDPTKNYIEILHQTNQLYTDIKLHVTLDFGEPFGQTSFDNVPSVEGNYVFDELGIKAAPDQLGNKMLLTHVIFHPVQKSLNRVIEIIYTIRIAMT